MAEKLSYAELERKVALLERRLERAGRFDKINKALTKIAFSVSSTENLDELFRSIHRSLSDIIDTTNFFIALYDELRDTVTFPYHVDITETDGPTFVGMSSENSLTVRVIKSRAPLLVTKNELIRQQVATGGEMYQGVIPEVWMGTPLITRKTIIGAIVVQSYKDPTMYGMEDVEIMGAVAAQVAIAIERKQIEYKLQGSITRFKKLIEDVFGIAIQGYDENRRTIFWNKASEQLYGYSEEEALGQSLESLIIPPSIKDDVINLHQKWVHQGIPIAASELILQDKYGADVPVFSSHVMHDTADGKEMYCIDIDLKPVKRAEESLRVVNAQFAAAMDSLDAIVYVADMHNHELLFMNSMARDMSGADVGDICWQVFQSEQDGPCSFCTNKHLLDDQGRAKAPFVWEVQNSKDGEWYQCRDRAILWPDGRLVRLEIAVNITSRKKMEEQLLESEQKHRVIFESSPLGMVYCNADGSIIDCNDKFLKLMGVSRKQLVNFSTLNQLSRSMATAIEKALAGEKSSFEDRYTSVTGKKTSYLRVMINPVLPGRNPTSIIATLEDITERKRIENEREKLESQLQQAQKIESIGRLAGGVAHDFNNMLGVILGRAELIMDDTDESFPFKDDIFEIYKAARRSADLTGQLLAFARKQTVMPQVIDLNDKVSDILSMLRRLLGETIELSWQPGEKLWPVKIDPVQIDQILTNLCINGRDAVGGKGKVCIVLSNARVRLLCDFKSREIQYGDFVLLSVSDDGIGMDKDVLESLFEPFFTTKGVGQGTGLGLATVYGIVQQNKGFVDVKSRVGRGSTFEVYFPRCVPEKRSTSGQHTKTAGLNYEKTILLVEDDPAILKLTKIMLDRLGYNVVSAHSAMQAFQKARDYKGIIDVVLTDVIMPEMDGRRLARKITALYPDVHKLFMSGYTDEVIASSGVLEEGVHFIQKPFTKNELSEKLGQVLS